MVTTLLSIGDGEGLANSSSAFSSMVSQSDFRKLNASSEMANMAALFDEWGLAIESESGNSSGSQLILTMVKNLDWVHVMPEGYYKPSWWNYTAAFAALYDPGSEVSTEYGINAWIDGGLSANKLVLGLPFYGYAWTLANPNDSAIGAPAKGSAITDDVTLVLVYATCGYVPPEYVKHGIYSTKSDVYSFGVLLLQIISGKRNNCLHGLHEDLKLLDYMHRIETLQAYDLWKCGKGMEFMDPLLDDTNSSFWIGYDDAEAIRTKVSYAREKGLLGYKVWHVANDDNWVLSKAAQEDEKDPRNKRQLLLVIFLLPTADTVTLVLVSVTCGYVPPEYVKRGIYSTKSDVYSFRGLLLQIISGKQNNCLHGLHEDLNLLEYASNSENCDMDIAN
ncbi:hypothetical protein RHSIM_Rhsim01G0187500 [Rhododendron simsii]|uniref:GH18 domain-containing protein n=1 Tax=Rhododendron simsii TaxID=118357 RepID=A0A834LZB7_RHOSS|nr:hypothetical protein RHSIM_Rhsim01G0187500 [Rhododendron simsii]